MSGCTSRCRVNCAYTGRSSATWHWQGNTWIGICRRASRSTAVRCRVTRARVRGAGWGRDAPRGRAAGSAPDPPRSASRRPPRGGGGRRVRGGGAGGGGGGRGVGGGGAVGGVVRCDNKEICTSPDQM